MLGIVSNSTGDRVLGASVFNDTAVMSYQTTMVTSFNVITGSVDWSNTYDFGNLSNPQDVAFVGGFLFVTGRALLSGTADIFLIKIDPTSGSVVWTNTYTTPSADDSGMGMIVTPDNNIIIAAALQPTTGGRNIEVLKIAPADGSVVWSKEISTDVAMQPKRRSVTVDSSGNVFMAASGVKLVSGTDYAYDAFLIKLDQIGRAHV